MDLKLSSFDDVRGIAVTRTFIYNDMVDDDRYKILRNRTSSKSKMNLSYNVNVPFIVKANIITCCKEGKLVETPYPLPCKEIVEIRNRLAMLAYNVIVGRSNLILSMVEAVG